jgi:hypothetical protein
MLTHFLVIRLQGQYVIIFLHKTRHVIIIVITRLQGLQKRQAGRQADY